MQNSNHVMIVSNSFHNYINNNNNNNNNQLQKNLNILPKMKFIECLSNSNNKEI